jgi:hypothetical protein
MALATGQYNYAVGLADVLRWPAWEKRQPPPAQVGNAAGEQAVAENIGSAPLGRPVTQRALSESSSSIQEDTLALQFQADPFATPLTAEELDSRPIAYTSSGDALFQSLPQGVLLDILA